MMMKALFIFRFDSFNRICIVQELLENVKRNIIAEYLLAVLVHIIRAI